MYEFHDHIERQKAAKKQLEEEDDRMEGDVKQANLDWAEAEELKELDALNAEVDTKKVKTYKPTKEDIEWAEEKMKEAKEAHGESFGENIDEDFN